MEKYLLCSSLTKLSIGWDLSRVHSECLVESWLKIELVCLFGKIRSLIYT